MRRERKVLIKTLTEIAQSPLLGCANARIWQALPDTDLMPAVFLGNNGREVLANAGFANELEELRSILPRPRAIVCVSADWLSKGSILNYHLKSHDFHARTPSQNAAIADFLTRDNSEFAHMLKQLLASRHANVRLQYKNTIDHGTLAMLGKLFPQRDIPMVQLSIDYLKSPQQHYALGKALGSLRQKGIMTIGSGCLVRYANKPAATTPAATTPDPVSQGRLIDIDRQIQKWILDGDHRALIEYEPLAEECSLFSVRPQYHLPLLYVLSQQRLRDRVTIFNETLTAGTQTMTSMVMGI